MTEDISKNTLLVLVVLTIIISLLGTWTVISESSKMSKVSGPTAGEQASLTEGKVTVNIQPRAGTVAAVGHVVLTIVPEE